MMSYILIQLNMKRSLRIQINRSLSSLATDDRFRELNKRSTKIIATLHTQLYNNIHQTLDHQIFLGLFGIKNELDKE
jgi:hypothetical protein